MPPITIINRRFTCLTPRLVRMEYSPSAYFEDRSTLLAFRQRQPLDFIEFEEREGTAILKTNALTITSSQNERDFSRYNLKIEWIYDGLTSTYLFGDRDYFNLGGANFSLDYFGPDSRLDGVHPGSIVSPDDYLHTETELLDIFNLYLRDGKAAWLQELVEWGTPAAMRYAPHLVYNRLLNLGFDPTRFSPGLLSKSGYFLLNDSNGPTLDEDGFPMEREARGARDYYFCAYGSNYQAAMQDYFLLSGPVLLPPKNLLGILFSRYPAFSDPEARALVERFEQEGLPLGALFIDLEWHTQGFMGWDWNSATYPDPEGFCRWMKMKNVLTALNVHPQQMLSTDSHFKPFVEAAGVKDRIQSALPSFLTPTIQPGDLSIAPNLARKPEAQAYRSICLDPIFLQGVDFLWADGAAARIDGAHDQFITNKLFAEAAGVNDQRGIVMGRYGGLGSHRYGLAFTGDTHSTWEVLQKECEYNIRAGQSGMAYVTHDTGGFLHNEAPIIDPDLYIRWLQFGVFSPIIRFHSSPGAGSRLPWDYGDRNLAIARRYLVERLRLLPYIYTAAWRVYEFSEPMVRGLYVEHPKEEAAYRFDEYFFGPALLVAPVLSPVKARELYLPPGLWVEYDSGARVEGGRGFTMPVSLEKVPVYIKAGSVLPLQGDLKATYEAHNRVLVLDIYPGASGEGFLYEDDGRSTGFERGEFAITLFRLEQQKDSIRIWVSALKGKPFGSSRAVTLRVALPGSPVAVRVDGNILPPESVHQSAAGGRILIDIGERPVQQEWVVDIEMDDLYFQ